MDDIFGYSPEAEQIARRRKMAEMMMQQGSEMPQGQMVSGRFVAPNVTQYLAQALKSYMGGRGINQADQQMQALRDKATQERNAWLQQMPQSGVNTSAEGPVIPQQPTAEDYTNWAIRGMQIDPRSAALGMQSANLALNREAQAAARQQAQQNFLAQMQQRKELAAQTDARMRELAAMNAGNRQYSQALPTEQGYMRFNTRTGQMEPLLLNGQTVLPAAQSPNIQGQVSQSKAFGTEQGQTQGKLAGTEASIPSLEKTVKDLKDLSGKMTYTLAGQGRDIVARQAGIATPGAVAREKYINTVRDTLFPLLRQTFGAQFTVKEGEALIATLGDPNKTPEERNAVLDAFLTQKKRDIESMRRQLGDKNVPTETQTPKRIRFDAQGNEIKGMKSND